MYTQINIKRAYIRENKEMSIVVNNEVYNYFVQRISKGFFNPEQDKFKLIVKQKKTTSFFGLWKREILVPVDDFLIDTKYIIPGHRIIYDPDSSVILYSVDFLNNFAIWHINQYWIDKPFFDNIKSIMFGK